MSGLYGLHRDERRICPVLNVEFGTGKYSTTGGGTHKESWTYMDEFGNWHIAHPMRERPYLKPAVADHTRDFLNILKDSLENA